MSVVAHAQSGPVDLAGLAFVGVFVAVAAFWLVRSNRRLDAVPVGGDHQAKEYEADAPERPTADAGRSPGASALLAAVVVVALGVVGFYAYRAQSHPAPGQAQNVVDDLCLAAQQAASDPAAALATFNGRPHDALHSLDTQLRKVDPIAAARLAAAKLQAERAMTSSSANAPQLTTGLAEAVAAAYRTVEPERRVNSCA